MSKNRSVEKKVHVALFLILIIFLFLFYVHFLTPLEVWFKENTAFATGFILGLFIGFFGCIGLLLVLVYACDDD